MKTLMIVAGLLITTSASAMTASEEAYYTLGAPQVRELGAPDGTALDKGGIGRAFKSSSLAGALGSSGEISLTDGLQVGGGEGDLSTGDPEIDTLINIGRAVWKIAEKNRPVVDYEEHVATIVPAGTRDWTDLEGWQEPVTRTYEVTYTNLYGVTVVRFVYQVQFTPGGSLDGNGRYISGATILPVDLDVAWGYKFDATVRAEEIVNVGTRANPVAALTLGVHWKVDTILKHSRSSASFFLQGNGRIRAL